MLVYLAERASEVVDQESVLRDVWQGAFVTNEVIWVYDAGRETLTRLTTSPGEEEHSIFTPDGREVTYDYSLSGPFRVFSRAADGASEARAITAESHNERPESYSRDGKTLVVSQEHSETGFDLWRIELEGEPQRRPLLVTPFDERSASLSPDGRWIAYSSNESGRFEVYVASFPEPGARFQVSVDGARSPGGPAEAERSCFSERTGERGGHRRLRKTPRRKAADGVSVESAAFVSRGGLSEALRRAAFGGAHPADRGGDRSGIESGARRAQLDPGAGLRE